MASFVVVYDACVLYPAPLRDLLIRLAGTCLVQVKWTDEILDEVFRNILKDRPDLKPENLARTRKLMSEAIPDVSVTHYAGLADRIELPDEDDKHVLAAAIRSGAQGIVTSNLKDFPAVFLEPLDIEAIHPDRFVLDLLDLSEGIVLQCLNEQVAALKKPPVSMSELLDMLEKNGLVQSVAELRIFYGLSG